MKNTLAPITIFILSSAFAGPAFSWDKSNCVASKLEENKKKLSPMEFEVTQREGTEPPFKNRFNEEKREGIYVDIVSGEPLFSSTDKYDSGTGWPSFVKPLVSENIVERKDRKLFTVRTEVRSKCADSHLGHVFTDGPKPTGLRYCMNSAALRFVPKADLQKEGYGEFVSLFSAGVKKNIEKAVFAGGCFWCMEPPFDSLPGVQATTSGYIGGKKENPTYKEVSSGNSGHVEAVEVTYDPSLTGYEKLLEVFWQNVDPLDGAGQFCDKGPQYQSAIYFDDSQKALALQSISSKEKKLGKKIETKALALSKFYPAEDYHQDYYKKNPIQYKFYRFNCGRDKRLKEVWGK